MRYRDDTLDDLVRRSASVRDEDLASLVNTPAANNLFDELMETPRLATHAPNHPELESRSDPVSRQLTGRRGTGRRRVTQILIAAVLALAVGLSVPAFGVVKNIKSWLHAGQGGDLPVAVQPDVLIASGVNGVPWRIVATQTDHGLCVFNVFMDDGSRAGSGGCNRTLDIQGYPGASPLGYGSGGDQLHWVEGSNGGGGDRVLNRRIIFGVAAVDVSNVDLVLAGGETMHANVVEQPAGIDPPINFWWAVLPAEVDGVDLTTLAHAGEFIPVHEMIALDSSGAVLEQRIVDQLNHP